LSASATIITPAEFHKQKELRHRERLRKLEQRRKANRTEHPGRDYAKPHGTWITDMGELQKSILLCRGCAHKFDPKKYNYYRTREFRVLGKCDACREHDNEAVFFLHHSLVGQKHGQCWKPR
jgi:hypothetical protein